MPIVHRPARADELQATQAHIIRSINDLTERHGSGAMASVRPPDFQLFSWKDDPRAFGRPSRTARWWVCLQLGSGNLWFLAELFVAPGPARAGHRQRTAETDAGPRRQGGRHAQGAHHLHVQSGFAGTLHPARALSPSSRLYVQCVARRRDGASARRAYEMRSHREYRRASRRACRHRCVRPGRIARQAPQIPDRRRGHERLPSTKATTVPAMFTSISAATSARLLSQIPRPWEPHS